MHAECRNNGQAERDAEHSYGIETAGIRPQGGLFSVTGLCAKTRSAARIT